jgi:hypothetical protein
MKARTGLTKGEIVNIITTLFDIIVTHAQNTQGTELLFNSFRVSVSSGGSFTDPETSLTNDLISPSLNICFVPAPLAGDHKLTVRVKYAANLRSADHGPLLPALQPPAKIPFLVLG